MFAMFNCDVFLKVGLCFTVNCCMFVKSIFFIDSCFVGWDTNRAQSVWSVSVPHPDIKSVQDIFDSRLFEARNRINTPPQNSSLYTHKEDKISVNNTTTTTKPRPLRICNALDVQNRIAFDHMWGFQHPNFSMNTQDHDLYMHLLREQNTASKQKSSSVLSSFLGSIVDSKTEPPELDPQISHPEPLTDTTLNNDPSDHCRRDKPYLPYITGLTSWMGGKAESFEPAEVARLSQSRIYMYTLHYQGMICC